MEMGYNTLSNIGTYAKPCRLCERSKMKPSRRLRWSQPLGVMHYICHMPQFAKQFNVIEEHYVIFYAKVCNWWPGGVKDN